MSLPDSPLGPTTKEIDQEVWIVVEYVSKIDQQGAPDGYESFKLVGVFNTRDGARTTRQLMEKQAKEIESYRRPTYLIETRTVRNHPEELRKLT
jgi:hypothetical protein